MVIIALGACWSLTGGTSAAHRADNEYSIGGARTPNTRKGLSQ